MSISGSYHIHPARRNEEIQRLARQARSGWDKEVRNLSWFGLENGQSILEVGSGPGFITEQLLTSFPNSSITCVEIDATLLEQAKQHLHDKAGQRVHFVEGSVMDMRLESKQYDFAFARYLFQHLPDPMAAAKEILRVLKPGGRLVVHDIDDEIFGFFAPPIPGLPLIIEKFGEAQASRGGDRHIGRRLWNILEVAGFSNLDLEILSSHSGYIGVEPFLKQIHPDRMTLLVDKGFISADELSRYRGAHENYLSNPQPFTIWMSLMICGEKPNTSEAQ